MDNVNCLDDVSVMQGRANAELSGDLLVVFPLALVSVTGTELLHGKSLAVGGSLHQSHRAASARTKNSTKFAIFGCQSVVIGKRHALRLTRWRRSAAPDWRTGAALVFLVTNLEETFQADFGGRFVLVFDGALIVMIMFLSAEKAGSFVRLWRLEACRAWIIYGGWEGDERSARGAVSFARISVTEAESSVDRIDITGRRCSLAAGIWVVFVALGPWLGVRGRGRYGA